jgi:bifunctional non-homologous end joining protein LigD
MPLKEYRKKRDFTKTPEPAGAKARARKTGLSFVIQKHAASRLHYDFRLEWDGTLKSWSVPKGPSFDPAEKRLAVEVEDHPIEYGGFEGTIPKGQYGGGAVLLWDRGTWEPVEPPDFRKGRLKFNLYGDKLAGRWALVRMAPRPGDSKPNWLLIKDKDAYMRRSGDITEERPESVESGRLIEEIAEAKAGRTWQSKPKAGARAGNEKLKKLAAKARLPVPKGVRKGTLSRTVEPELATLVTKVPTSEGWLFEIKYDGYRILARVDGGKVNLISRNNKDWSDRFAPVARGLAALKADAALIDGEVVALADDGTTDFQALQNHIKSGRTDDLVYYAFDLLHLDGNDLTPLPLTERKATLERLLKTLGKQDRIRFSDHVVGHGEHVLAQAKKLHLEGVIAKRMDAPYRAGRGKDWLKIKCIASQEFVIGGWTDPAGSRKGLGAILIGVHEDGALRYAGRVGTGFTEQSLRDLSARFAKIATPKSPFSDKPPGVAGTIHYVKPELVAEVDFIEWTRDGHLRHPSFRGLREDKPAKAVVREKKQAPPAADDPPPPKRAAARKAKAGEVVVAGVPISHPDRVVYPKVKLTKLELARYYEMVGPRMIEQIRERPIMMLRVQQGIDRPMFFQKNAGPSIPRGIGTVQIPDEKHGGPDSTYLQVETVEGLVGLVQLGVVEFHVWGSRARALEKPDRIVFDLDPDPTVPWSKVVDGALRVRAALEGLKLETFLKTTGGKGLHVVAPLDPLLPWAEVKEITRQVSLAVVQSDPKGFTANMAKAKRTGKIFLDYLRNGRGATWIAPYAARARENAGVSMPIPWSSIRKVDPAAFNVPALLKAGKLPPDAWKGIYAVRQRLR